MYRDNEEVLERNDEASVKRKREIEVDLESERERVGEKKIRISERETLSNEFQMNNARLEKEVGEKEKEKKLEEKNLEEEKENNKLQIESKDTYHHLRRRKPNQEKGVYTELLHEDSWKKNLKTIQEKILL
jgi:hypothetical protein